jgi:DNA-binding MarR family transcriptional regulator
MMDDRLVQDMNRILHLLLKGRTNTNAIIKQTGIYKNNVFEAIKYLEKAGLAIRFKDKKVHRQKVFIRLNEFGQQLAG